MKAIDADFSKAIRDIQNRQEQIKQKQDQIGEDIGKLADDYGLPKPVIKKAIKLAEKEQKSPGTLVIEESIITIAREL